MAAQRIPATAAAIYAFQEIGSHSRQAPTAPIDTQEPEAERKRGGLERNRMKRGWVAKNKAANSRKRFPAQALADKGRLQ